MIKDLAWMFWAHVLCVNIYYIYINNPLKCFRKIGAKRSIESNANINRCMYVCLYVLAKLEFYIYFVLYNTVFLFCIRFDLRPRFPTAMKMKLVLLIEGLEAESPAWRKDKNSTRIVPVFPFFVPPPSSFYVRFAKEKVEKIVRSKVNSGRPWNDFTKEKTNEKISLEKIKREYTQAQNAHPTYVCISKSAYYWYYLN